MFTCRLELGSGRQLVKPLLKYDHPDLMSCVCVDRRVSDKSTPTASSPWARSSTSTLPTTGTRCPRPEPRRRWRETLRRGGNQSDGANMSRDTRKCCDWQRVANIIYTAAMFEVVESVVMFYFNHTSTALLALETFARVKLSPTAIYRLVCYEEIKL